MSSTGLREALERESERIAHSPAILSALERLLFFSRRPCTLRCAKMRDRT